MKKEKRIPTFIGLIVLTLCVGVGVFLTQNKTTIGSKASGDCSPVNPQTTNITDTAVDISFYTETACQVSLSMLDQTFLDVKSQNGSTSSSVLHYFQIKHLQAQKKYTYSVISEGHTLDSSEYNFTTSSTPSSQLPTSNLAWGKVLSSDGKTPANAIVYLNIPGAAPLSSFVSSNGNWSISLASSFNDSKNNWFTPPEAGIEEDIIVVSDDSQITQVTNNSLSNNPVPNIIVGINSLTAPTSIPLNDESVGIGQVGSISPVVAKKPLEISNPKSNESLTVSKPDFFGSAPVNTSVSIYLDSTDTITGQVNSDASGVWHWSPTSGLSLGPHIITIKNQDSSTKLWSQVSRSFTILSSESSSSPQYEASGSAKPTLEPTSTITPSPSPAPTIRTAHPSVAVKPPVTGNTIPTVIIIASSLILFVISVNLIK